MLLPGRETEAEALGRGGVAQQCGQEGDGSCCCCWNCSGTPTLLPEVKAGIGKGEKGVECKERCPPCPSKPPFHHGIGRAHQHPLLAQPGCRRAELPVVLHPQHQGVTGVGYMPPTSICVGRRLWLPRWSQHGTNVWVAAPTPPTQQLVLPCETERLGERRGLTSAPREKRRLPPAPLPGQSWAGDGGSCFQGCGGEGGWCQAQQSRNFSPTMSS